MSPAMRCDATQLLVATDHWVYARVESTPRRWNGDHFGKKNRPAFVVFILSAFGTSYVFPPFFSKSDQLKDPACSLGTEVDEVS